MKTARVLVLGTAAMVSACHGDSGTPDTNKPQLNTAAAVKKGPSAQELTAGMVEAASSGKSQLAVQLKFDLPQRPIVGRTIDVNLAILPQIDASVGRRRIDRRRRCRSTRNAHRSGAGLSSKRQGDTHGGRRAVAELDGIAQAR
jgi:hypothetical protein